MKKLQLIVAACFLALASLAGTAAADVVKIALDTPPDLE